MNAEELMTRIRAFQESRAILTAVELDVFTVIGDGATAAETASRTGAHPRSMEMLLNALAACELLTKDTDGRFYNTELSTGQLTADGRMATLHSANLWHTWSTLTGAVRAGTCVNLPGAEARDATWTEAFIAAMHRGAAERAPAVVAAIGVDGVRRVLDVGGGSGAYSIAFARASELIHAVVLDLEPVTAIARRHIAGAGLAERVHTITGDLRADDLGRDYDIVFVSAICHMLNEEENVDLVRRCYTACRPGGRLVIQDFILGPDKTAPKFAALFALNMLVGTRGGNSYSAEEYTRWLLAAGFGGVRHVRLPGMTGLIIGTR